LTYLNKKLFKQSNHILSLFYAVVLINQTDSVGAVYFKYPERLKVQYV